MINESSANLYKEDLPDVCEILKKKSQKLARKETLTNTLPFFKWLPKYKPKFLLQDFVAGLTVGLTTIPQAIAYGVVAGLPPQYGLYSAFMGCFVYILFGSCKDVTVGPTAIMALMVQGHATSSPDFVVLACFISGCVILLLGLLNMGFLIQFISMPVTIGFSTAAAITIGSGQINSLIGLKSPSNAFVASWQNFFTNITHARWTDSLLGIGTLILLLCMRKIKDIKGLNKCLTKYLSLSRNALAVVIGAILAYCLTHDGNTPFKLSGQITPGLPPFELPPFSTTVNGTSYSFSEMISELGSSLGTIPLIAILESIAIAKTFSKGKSIDASQEMIALGMCNIMGSFVSSMPTTGSFTRTAINNASGVRTTLGGAVTGTLVLMALVFLTTTFYYIPKATLAAIIIAAMIFMVEVKKINELWMAKKSDFIPFLATLLCSLFWSLEYGILCGVGVNLVFVLYASARPKIVISVQKISGIEVGVVNVFSNLKYSSAEYLRSKVIKFVNEHFGRVSVVIICGEEIFSIDSTVAVNILSLREDLSLIGCELICWKWNYSAAGVICRFNREAQSMFKFIGTKEDVIVDHINSQNSISATITTTNQIP
ncbi:sodium-independent sulfate anion transporter isoform X2 [Eupeodes corollae]|uniref:sodium-independent sulfate anion transporter isoform X2 n=1 Tax=Eupeodes corollae TaxID=290404 RepID=UPI00248FE267|nr:sodium-independent sulfate anion transporter isoform X2 [Eupeodes corollae]